MPLVSGSHRVSINVDSGMRSHGVAYTGGDQFQHTYATLKDPVGGETDGWLEHNTRQSAFPKVMHMDSSTEAWGRAKFGRHHRFHLKQGRAHPGQSPALQLHRHPAQSCQQARLRHLQSSLRHESAHHDDSRAARRVQGWIALRRHRVRLRASLACPVALSCRLCRSNRSTSRRCQA